MVGIFVCSTPIAVKVVVVKAPRVTDVNELAPNVTSSSDEDNLGSILSNRKLSHNPEVYSGNSVRV